MNKFSTAALELIWTTHRCKWANEELERRYNERREQMKNHPLFKDSTV